MDDIAQKLQNVPKIEDYGLIGDMRTCALVGKNGSIDFMCWPKFDAPSTFARILDTEQGGGGHWSVSPRTTTVTKQNYRAASNILQTKWIDESGVVDLTDFFALSKSNSFLREKWSGSTLVRKLDCVRGSMSVDIELCPRPGYAQDPVSMRGSDVASEPDGKYHQSLSWAPESDDDDDDDDDNIPEIFVAYCTHGRPMSVAPKMFRPANTGSSPATKLRARFDLQEGHQVFMIMCNRRVAPRLTEELILGLETETYRFWTSWIRACRYRGRFQQEVERSMLILKLLTYDPTGAIIAAPTFSLPEAVGGPRNWDYRYSWVRDSSFTIYVFLKMGFPAEAEAYINFIFARIAEWRRVVEAKSTTTTSSSTANAHISTHEDSSHPDPQPHHLPLMFTIDGATSLPELTLPHLSGYQNSRPVRIGNAATDHVQLDIYGELMDSIYLYNKHGKPISYAQWLDIRFLTDFVCGSDGGGGVWTHPDMSIWEVRGAKQQFTYSKMLLWVAVDRALRLADKRNFPCPSRNRWLVVRDAIYEQVMEKGFNYDMNCFVQSYESNTTLDSAVLVAPLVFFMSPNDPQFVGTLDRIIRTPEKGGLTSAGFVFRYDTKKYDDGTYNLYSPWYLLLVPPRP
jgi:GH15 family glucan-1,4-alpha-glucosidase